MDLGVIPNSGQVLGLIAAVVLGALIGFTPIPVGFLIFIAIATGTYLVLVEIVKRRLMRRLLQ